MDIYHEHSITTTAATAATAASDLHIWNKKKRIIAQPVKDSKREAEFTLSEQLARRSRVRVYYIKHKRPWIKIVKIHAY